MTYEEYQQAEKFLHMKRIDNALMTFTPETRAATITYSGKFFRTEYSFYELIIAIRDLDYLGDYYGNINDGLMAAGTE